MTIDISYDNNSRHFEITQNNQTIKKLPLVFLESSIGKRNKPEYYIHSLQAAFTATHEPEKNTYWSCIHNQDRKNKGAYSKLGIFEKKASPATKSNITPLSRAKIAYASGLIMHTAP